MTEKQLISKAMSALSRHKKTITKKLKDANRAKAVKYWNSDDGKLRRQNAKRRKR